MMFKPFGDIFASITALLELVWMRINIQFSFILTKIDFAAYTMKVDVVDYKSACYDAKFKQSNVVLDLTTTLSFYECYYSVYDYFANDSTKA